MLGHARQSKLEEHRHFQRVHIAAEHREHAGAVVTADEIERGIEILLRVMFLNRPERVAGGLRTDLAQQEIEHCGAERIVHRRVQFAAEEILAQRAVAHLVGGVLPDLAEKERIFFLFLHRRADVADEAVRAARRQRPAASRKRRAAASGAPRRPRRREIPGTRDRFPPRSGDRARPTSIRSRGGTDRRSGTTSGIFPPCP